MNSKARKGIARDTVIYIPAKIIEGIIGILTLSLYSFLFEPSVLGEYTTINNTINLAAFIFTGWITQSSFRYINEYERTNRLPDIYSTNIFSLLIINLIVMLLQIICVFLFVHDEKGINIYLLAAFMFATFNISQTFISIISSLRKIKLNLLLSISSVSLKLAATAFFSQLFNNDIRAILYSNIIIDCVVIFIAIISLKLYRYVRLRFFSLPLIKKFISFGFPIAITSVTMWFLNVSDRFIIKLFFDNTQVGIYTTSYSVASAAFTMIMTGVMRGVYPVILKEWLGNNISAAEELLSLGARYFILVALPSAVGLSVLSKPIVYVMFDSKYWQGYSVITWVCFGMLFFGLSEYCNKAWELTGRTNAIFQNSLIAAVVSVALNVVLVSNFGYIFAAIVTFISYLLYFSLAVFRSRKILKWSISIQSYLKIFLSIFIMIIFLLLCNHFIAYTTMKLFIVIAIAAFIYLSVLIITGELKEELGFFKSKFKN